MPRPSSGEPPANPSPFYSPPPGLSVVVPGIPLNYHGQPLPPAPHPRSAPTLLGLLNALKRRWVMAGLIGGLAALTAGVAAWLALPAGKHEARAHVQIRFTSQDGITKPTEDPEGFRRDQLFLLKTRDLINRTLADPSVASLEMIRNSNDPVRLLEENIKVSMETPAVIAVALTGDYPQDMEVVLNQLVKHYLDDAMVQERKGRDDRTRKLERMAESFKAEISARERQIRLLADSHNTTGLEDAAAQNARIQQEIAKLDAEVFNTTKEIMELDAQISLLRSKLQAKRFDFSPTEVNQLIDSDVRVASLVRQRIEKDLILRKDEARASDPNAPNLVALRNELAQLDREITAMRAVVKPDVELALRNSTEASLSTRIAEMEEKKAASAKILEARSALRKSLKELVNSNVKGAFDIVSLQKELDPLRTVHLKIEEQLAALRIEKGNDPRLTARPAYVIPNKNIKQKGLVCAGAAVVALVGVLSLIGFLEWRTRRIDGVDQVVTDLGMRVIGTVPAFPNRANLKAAEATGGVNWRFVLNESINSTRTMLLHAARSQSMQVVMVTSATQGEGKTSLASQLATSMATAGIRTLIVDCDLRNPSIHKLFDLGLSAGISEVLCQEADVSDAVQPTSVPNLWVISAGQCSHRVINALAQGHPLETLFNRLRGQFDFVIVDSCPVLPVADALLVGQHVDGVLFSIMQDISQLPKVLVASEKLAQLNIPLVGAVVNGIRQNTFSYGYNYVKQLPA